MAVRYEARLRLSRLRGFRGFLHGLSALRNVLVVVILVDRARHAWCPGGRAALLAMADELGIPRHWYHGTPGKEHIDIPKRLIPYVLADPRVTVVTAREIVRAQRMDNGSHVG